MSATSGGKFGYHQRGNIPTEHLSAAPRKAGARPREYRLISRYTREEMGQVWSEEGKFRRWLEVELAATDTLAASGVVPAEAAAKIRAKARVDAGIVKRIAELEIGRAHV